MYKISKFSRLLPIFLSTVLLFGACSDDKKKSQSTAEKQQESKEVKPKDEKPKDEKPKETEAFKALLDASSDSNKIMASVERYYQAFIDAYGALGSVVAIVTPNGVTIKGFGTFEDASDPGSINFELASITKAFTGMALASMVNDDIVSLNTKLADCKPQGVDVTVPDDITLGDLTSHTSGLDMDMDGIINNYFDNVFYTKTSEKALWEGLAKTARPKKDIGQYKYSNYGVALLGSALAHCDGEENWWKVVEKRVIKPLGLEGMSPTAQTTPGYDPFGDPASWTWENIEAGAHAALRGNAKQLARLAQMMLSDDNFIGHSLLQKSQEHVYEFKNPLAQNYAAIGYNWLIGYYGVMAEMMWVDRSGNEYLDGIVDAHLDIVHHGGASMGHITEIFVAKNQKLAIISLHNARSATTTDSAYATLLAFGHIYGLGDVKEYEELMDYYQEVFIPPVIELTKEEKDALVGTYSRKLAKEEEIITIDLDANSDFTVAIDDEFFPAWPLSDNALSTVFFGNILFTLPEDGGLATSLVIDQKYVFNRVADSLQP